VAFSFICFGRMGFFCQPDSGPAHHKALGNLRAWPESAGGKEPFVAGLPARLQEAKNERGDDVF
jgi:hypothetical protein